MGTNFINGFLAPFRAISFLKTHKKCISYILVPFLINTIVFSSTAWLGINWFNSLINRYLPQGDAWYWAVLSFFVWTIAVLLVLVLIFFTFTVAGNLIASPFNELLSEKVEEILAGKSGDTPFNLKDFLKTAVVTIVEEAKKMTLFLLGMAGLFLLYLLPGIGLLLYPPLALAWTVSFLAVEYTGYVFSRKGKTFKEQRMFLKQHRALMAGFGLGVLMLLAIPFLQFFCIPLGVISATRLWWEEDRTRAPHQPA